jgi:hypothetical protein
MPEIKKRHHNVEDHDQEEPHNERDAAKPCEHESAVAGAMQAAVVDNFRSFALKNLGRARK